MKTQSRSAIAIIAIILITCANQVGAAIITNVPPKLPSQPVLAHSFFNPSTNAQSGAQQGYSVATDENFVVVGIPSATGPDTANAKNSGVVKVYDATTGALLYTLKNPTPSAPPSPPGPPDFRPNRPDNFGHSVSISSTFIVVGAPYDDVAYTDAGSAYLYNLASSTPTEPIAVLNNPEPTEGDGFGYSVAISGRQLVVGAPFNDTGAIDAGTIYYYDFAVPQGLPVLIDTLNNPNPSPNANFGYSVALTAPGAAVGAPGVGAAYVYDIGNRFNRSIPVAILTDPTPSTYNGFGSSVAISSTHLLVGAPYDDTIGLDAGSAYVYEHHLDRLTPTVLVATLTSPDPASLNFGYSVAMSDELLLIGEPSTDSSHIYDFSSATPTLAATLNNPSPAMDDRFGYSVGLSGTRVVVGAPTDDTRAADAGSAYIFDLAGATPTAPVATLDDPVLGTGGNAGRAVAVCGNTIVVGAAETHIYDLTSSTPAGPVMTLNSSGHSVAISGTLVVVGVPYANVETAYVYDLAGGTPTVPIIVLTNPTPNNWFGYSVSVSGTKVAVGAPLEGTGGADAGSVYVYDLASVTPAVPVTILNNPAIPTSGDRFGWSVSLSGTRLIVGAPTGAGRAYAYDLAGATPDVPVVTLNDPMGSITNHNFGWSVSVSGAQVVIGAPHGQESDPGVAYVYDLQSATPAVPIATLNNPFPQGQPMRPPGSQPDSFGESVAISGARVVVGTPFEGGAADSVGAAYLYDLASATPTTATTLFNPSPEAYDVFGGAVAVDGSTILIGAPGDDTNGADRGAAYVYRTADQ